MSSSVTPFRELGLAMASKKKLVFAMASSVVGLWLGRSSPARLFVGLGGAAVLDPTAFSALPIARLLDLLPRGRPSEGPHSPARRRLVSGVAQLVARRRPAFRLVDLACATGVSPVSVLTASAAAVALWSSG